MRSFGSLLGSTTTQHILFGQLATTIITPFRLYSEAVQRLFEQLSSINCQDLPILHILLAQLVSDSATEYVAEDRTNSAAL